MLRGAISANPGWKPVDSVRPRLVYFERKSFGLERRIVVPMMVVDYGLALDEVGGSKCPKG